MFVSLLLTAFFFQQLKVLLMFMALSFDSLVVLSDPLLPQALAFKIFHERVIRMIFRKQVNHSKVRPINIQKSMGNNSIFRRIWNTIRGVRQSFYRLLDTTLVTNQTLCLGRFYVYQLLLHISKRIFMLLLAVTE